MIKTERRTRDDKFNEFNNKTFEIGTKTKILKENEFKEEQNLDKVLAISNDATMSATEYADMLEEMYD